MKALTTFLFLIGCGTDVHVLEGSDAGEPEGDSGVRADAGASDDDAGSPMSDAGPGGDGHYYRLVPANVDFLVSPEMCDSYESVDKRFQVMHHWFSSCQEPGPIEVTVDESARTVTLQGWNWELVGPTDCRAIGAAVPRHVFVESLTNGTWNVTWVSGSVEIDVGGPPPPITCIEPGPAGTACLADCDCTEGRCVEPSNDGICGARTCQNVCNSWLDTPAFHPECGPGRECGPDPIHGNTCRVAARDLCSSPADCPAGTTCVSDADFPSYCAWDVILNATVRHPCNANTECDPGLECVVPLEGPTPGEFRGTCEVRCRTAEQSCPIMHACSLGGRALDREWVCEWIGE